jgi:hypothetical protein
MGGDARLVRGLGGAGAGDLAVPIQLNHEWTRTNTNKAASKYLGGRAMIELQSFPTTDEHR